MKKNWEHGWVFMSLLYFTFSVKYYLTISNYYIVVSSSSSLRLFMNEGWPLSGHEEVQRLVCYSDFWSEHPRMTTER